MSWSAGLCLDRRRAAVAAPDGLGGASTQPECRRVSSRRARDRYHVPGKGNCGTGLGRSAPPVCDQGRPSTRRRFDRFPKGRRPAPGPAQPPWRSPIRSDADEANRACWSSSRRRWRDPDEALIPPPCPAPQCHARSGQFIERKRGREEAPPRFPEVPCLTRVRRARRRSRRHPSSCPATTSGE